MSSINGTNIERMRVNNNEIALAKINGNVVFQKKKLIKTFFGDSKQETTTGKNLYYGTSDSYTFTPSSSDWYDIYGNKAIYGTNLDEKTNYKARVEQGKEYTLSVNVQAGNNLVNMAFVYDDETFIKTQANDVFTECTFTASKSGYVLLRMYINTGDSITVSNVQLEENSQKTDYEPYTGGKPSPNPDYPQEIKSISGVSLKLTGKNLFNKSTTNFIYGFLSNTSNTIVDTDNVKIYFLDCYPNSKYTISKIKGKYFRIATANKKPEIGMEISQLIVNDTEESITITTNSNAKYLFFNIFDISQDTIDEIEMLNSVQIEKGSQATNYEQYKNQTIPINLQENILAKVGDYADELQVYSNGDVKIVKKIGKTILNNTANYTKSTYSTDEYFRGYLNGEETLNFAEYKKVMNTHFQSGEYNQTSQGEMLANRRQLHIQILASRLSENSVTGLQEWLGNNNVTALRPLANSITRKVDNIKEELNSFGDYSNIEIETTYS